MTVSGILNATSSLIKNQRLLLKNLFLSQRAGVRFHLS